MDGIEYRASYRNKQQIERKQLTKSNTTKPGFQRLEEVFGV